MLEAIKDKINNIDATKFSKLASDLLNSDRKTPYIVDSRFKAELLSFVLKYDTASFRKRQINYLMKCDWWVKSSFIHLAEKSSIISKVQREVLDKFISNDIPDISLAVANHYLLSGEIDTLPKISIIAPVAQNILKESGMILRSQYTNSQINKYLFVLTGNLYKTSWKIKLGKEHNLVERTLYTALGYWKTDLTAFVNIMDTLDDRICSILTIAHPELGGYQLGYIGSTINRESKKFPSFLPNYFKMCLEIHEMRSTSHLSHSEIRQTHKYTGPIPQNKRNPLHRYIIKGIDELIRFW